MKGMAMYSPFDPDFVKEPDYGREPFSKVEVTQGFTAEPLKIKNHRSANRKKYRDHEEDYENEY